MATKVPLPPGQCEVAALPRFGLLPLATRFPSVTDSATLQLAGDVRTTVTVGIELSRIARVAQCSDFHCVTTWTRRQVPWTGMRFSDFYHQLVVPLAGPHPDAAFVVLRGQDGARTSLPLTDLLNRRCCLPIDWMVSHCRSRWRETIQRNNGDNINGAGKYSVRHDGLARSSTNAVTAPAG